MASPIPTLQVFSKKAPGSSTSEKSGEERISILCNNYGEIPNNFPYITTLYESFQRGVRIFGNKPCLGSRQPNQPYQFLTYKEIEVRATNFGSGLIGKCFQPQPTTFVGILSKNCIEWVIVEQSCNAYNMVLVPLYDTLGTESIQHIITQTEANIVVLSSDNFEQNLKSLTSVGIVELVIKIGTVTHLDRGLAASCKVELISMAVIEEEGARNIIEHTPPTPEDLATISYTSGTTSQPKGVMLTHKSIIASICSANAVISRGYNFSENDVYISYLPLSHLFERLMQIHIFLHGSRICFFRGDATQLLNDIQMAKPTIFATVPRILNRIYDQVKRNVNDSLIKRKLFSLAMKSKLNDLDRGIVRTNTVWDKLLFHKVRTLLGGRVAFIITGAAPILPEVLAFTRCAMGCMVLEGYGQTECAGAATVCFPRDFTTGHVGPPLPGVTIKLIDAPDCEYYAKDRKGEICLKGNNLFLGYFKDNVKTKAILDDDGWLHSGDIGAWTQSGCLQIIDRIKDITKLSNGEFISPEKIEMYYSRHPAILQVFVHANSLYRLPVALIVPDPDAFPKWARHLSFPESINECCELKEVVDAILRETDEIARENGLNSFERIKYAIIIGNPFTIDNDQLTPTLKMKRPMILKAYTSEINKLLDSIQ